MQRPPIEAQLYPQGSRRTVAPQVSNTGRLQFMNISGWLQARGNQLFVVKEFLRVGGCCTLAVQLACSPLASAPTELGHSAAAKNAADPVLKVMQVELLRPTSDL